MFTNKDDILKDARARMKKAVDLLKSELAKMRTGRASISILDDIRVDYYGNPTPLNHVATLATPDARLITIQPWEPSLITAIEKAIQKSDLGLNPTSDGKIIRLPIPSLTEERRRDLARHLKKHGEDAKVAIRNIRRDANEHLKKLEKEQHVSEDDIKKAEADCQKFTDDSIREIDDIIAKKEKEIMTV